MVAHPVGQTAVIILVLAFAVVMGLIIGSFLNVVIARVPRGVSLSSPPSTCPRCGNRIRARDNIPVLSWVALGGECRDCREPISARYPIVELFTGVMFGLVALWWMTVPWGPVPLPTFVAGVAGGAVVVSLWISAVGIDYDGFEMPAGIAVGGAIASAATGLTVAATLGALDGWHLLQTTIAAVVGVVVVAWGSPSPQTAERIATRPGHQWARSQGKARWLMVLWVAGASILFGSVSWVPVVVWWVGWLVSQWIPVWRTPSAAWGSYVCAGPAFLLATVAAWWW